MALQFHIGQRDINSTPYHWIHTETVHFDSQPTLFFLPGSNAGVNTVNGALKYLSDYFQSPNDMRLLGCNYSGHAAHQDKTDIQFEAGELCDILSDKYEPLYSDSIKNFFNNCFLSLICDENGQKLPVEESIKRMRAVTLITHCYGSLIAYKIDHFLNQKIQELDYSPSEQKQIMKSLTIINLASRCPIGHAHSNMIHIVSLNDDFWLDNWKAETVNALIDKTAFDANHFDKKSDTKQLLYFSPSKQEHLFLLPQIQIYKGEDHNLEFYVKKQHPGRSSLAQQVFSLIETFILQKSTRPQTTFQSVLDKADPAFMQNLKQGEKRFQSIYRTHLIRCRAGRSILPQVVQKNYLSATKKILQNKDISPILKDNQGHFPLYYAIQNQSVEMINLFFNNIPFFNLIRLTEKGRPLWQTALDNHNPFFIYAFLSEVYSRNPSQATDELSPFLREHCFDCIEKNIDCSAIIPFAFKQTAKDCYWDIISDLKKAYHLIDQTNISTATQNNKICLLNTIKTFAQKEEAYTLGGGSVVLNLKNEKAPQEIIDIFHQARLSYLSRNQKNIPINLKHLLIGQTPHLALFDVLPYSDKLKEKDYLHKVNEYLFWNESDKTKRVLNRLEKRYNRLTQKLIQDCIKERNL